MSQSANEKTWIEELPKKIGQTVKIQGWVYQKRSSGKIRFLQVRDGTGIVQCVLVQGESEEAAFSLFDQAGQESSIEVVGVVKADTRSSLGAEIGLKSLSVVQVAKDYPISPKDHGVEFLMQNRHLWIRSQKQWAALRVRARIMKEVDEFFEHEGFTRFDPPILTPSSCEGTSQLFETPYFEEKAYLTQSGQLYAEAGAMALGKVYSFGPTFRAEKSATRKHLTEFWMIEPEIAYGSIQDVMTLGEKFVKHLIRETFKKCSKELKILERDEKAFAWIEKPFPVISYDEALKILEKAGCGIPWGEDFGAPHEKALGDAFGAPVWVHHMPAQIKAFYFKQSDEINGPGVVGKNGKYALGCDLIAPDGYGEVIGGGQREDDCATLEGRIREHQLPLKDYEWYLDLRRYGSVQHAGFGLGLERTVAWVSGVPHVRETIPFPRMMNTLRP